MSASVTPPEIAPNYEPGAISRTLDEAFSKLRDEWKCIESRCQDDLNALRSANLGDILGSQDHAILKNPFSPAGRAPRIELDQLKCEILQQLLNNSDWGYAQWKQHMFYQTDSKGVPLLHRAVEQEAVDCVALLLREGADVEQRSSDNNRETAWELLMRSRLGLNGVIMDFGQFSRSKQRSEQIQDLLTQALFAKEHPLICNLTGAVSTWGIPVTNIFGTIATKGSFLELPTMRPTGAQYLWVHIPSTNVSVSLSPWDVANIVRVHLRW
jgi:hypothetical protein